jgi:GGDEF domain-containing protein
VAQILAESVRLMDTVARFGNEQFILVAPGPDGLVVAERLVRGIAALPPVDGGPISVSAGIAGFPLDGRTPDELLAVAEKAMHAARQAGGAESSRSPRPPSSQPRRSAAGTGTSLRSPSDGEPGKPAGAQSRRRRAPAASAP